MTEARNRKAILVTTSLAAFSTPFMAAGVNVALPAIGEEFSVSAVALSWVAMAYLLAAAVFLVPFGRLADIHGRRKIFAWGVAVYTLFSLFCGVAWSNPVLILFRVGQGIGGALIFGTATAILTSAFPAGERGRVLGLNVAAVYLGLSAGPLFGGFLTQHFGWRSIFLLSVPLGLAVLLLVLTRIKEEWIAAPGERFDLAGSLFYGLGLISLMYGFSLLPALRGGLLVAAGVAGIAGFVRWETKTSSPVLNVSLFRGNRTFLFSNLAALINYSATSAVAFLLNFYLQHGRGLSPQSAGLLLVAQPVLQMAFSPLAGRLSDRVPPRVVASIGMGLTVVGLMLLSLLGRQTPLVLVVLELMLLGFSFALFSSPNTNAVMSAVDKRCYGVAAGTLATMRMSGQMLSIGIAMLCLSLFAGAEKLSPETYARFLPGTRLAFAVFAGLCLLGVLASLARGRSAEERLKIEE